MKGKELLAGKVLLDKVREVCDSTANGDDGEGVERIDSDTAEIRRVMPHIEGVHI